MDQGTDDGSGAPDAPASDGDGAETLGDALAAPDPVWPEHDERPAGGAAWA
ncbi:hypothetical protein [Phycicoccus sonneratiae]|uniref:Uncharacterized protein n=1 Tax=Phycicoccus sonneratiae TaxID=2807628 RepID=A0ABS2CIQ6_9MICO|nr:hypothetical protein [Phycicoccus sonneraticus]MBM6398994.1 hypothetical protein [Phycicoccus sonneraticus]